MVSLRCCFLWYRIGFSSVYPALVCFSGSVSSSSVSSCIVSVRKILEWIAEMVPLFLPSAVALYRLLYHRHPRNGVTRCRMLLLPGPHYRNQYLLNFHYQKYFLPGSRPECFQRHHSHLLYPDFPHCQIRCFLCWNYLRQNHLREIYPHHHFFLHQKLPALLLLLFRSQPVSFFLHHQLVPDLELLLSQLLLLSQFKMQSYEGSIRGFVSFRAITLPRCCRCKLFSFFSNAVI